MRVLQGVAALVVGLTTAGAAVVLHDTSWALILAWVATLLTIRALPAGLPGRVPYALGWMLVLAVSVTRTDAGGYLLESSTSGYAVLLLGLIAFSAAIATFPLKRRRRLARHDQSTRDPDTLAR